jgi:hypothetical protein
MDGLDRDSDSPTRYSGCVASTVVTESAGRLPDESAVSTGMAAELTSNVLRSPSLEIVLEVFATVGIEKSPLVVAYHKSIK